MAYLHKINDVHLQFINILEDLLIMRLEPVSILVIIFNTKHV